MKICIENCQRPYSIRTRIKTRRDKAQRILNKVRDHIPLEQGLRPITRLFLKFFSVVRDHIPLEQGLRLSAYFWTDDGSSVRDHIPLEQGLRRCKHI